MPDEQQLIENAVRYTMDSYYQTWVVIGISFIGTVLFFMAVIIGFFLVRHFKKADHFEEHSEQKFVSKEVHSAEANAIRREMLTCQQGLKGDIEDLKEQHGKTDGKVAAVHRRIDDWFKNPPQWYQPGAKS